MPISWIKINQNSKSPKVGRNSCVRFSTLAEEGVYFITKKSLLSYTPKGSLTLFWLGRRKPAVANS